MWDHYTGSVILKSFCWFVGISSWEYMILEKNPSSNICLISAGRSGATERAALDWCYDTITATSYSAPRLVVYSGVIDDTNSQSYKVFVLQRSMKCLSSPEIREQSIIRKLKRWLPCNRLRSTGLLKAVVYVCIWKSASLPSKNEGKGLGLCLLLQILCSFLIWKWLRLLFGSFSRLCLSLSISLERVRKWKRWEIGAKTRE